MSNYHTLKHEGYIGKIADVFNGCIVKFDKILKNDLTAVFEILKLKVT